MNLRLSVFIKFRSWYDGHKKGVLALSRQNVILIGFMGTGKSTVGQIIADKLGWTFVDTDAWIVEKAGKTIPELFASAGEAAFRALERDALHELLSGERRVLATGGGAVLAAENRERMLSGGLVVALTAPREAIIERVRNDRNRPLLHGVVEERVASLLEARSGAYDFAHLTVDTAPVTPDEAADTIVRTLRDSAQSS